MENSRYAYLDTVSVDVSSPNPNGISRSNSATSVIDSDYGGREGGVPLPSFGSNIGPLPQICLYYCPVSRSDMLYFTIAVTKSFLWLILVWGGDVWGPLFWWCLRHHPRPYSAPFSYPPPPPLLPLILTLLLINLSLWSCPHPVASYFIPHIWPLLNIFLTYLTPHFTLLLPVVFCLQIQRFGYLIDLVFPFITPQLWYFFHIYQRISHCTSPLLYKKNSRRGWELAILSITKYFFLDIYDFAPKYGRLVVAKRV